jgi:glutathione S-transferase|tara:strand:+ start:523 stop:639 length:117 start_codon:yes stop_codon:yes gene_type:complete
MIELFTASTSNGHKLSIALEEMGVEYSEKIIETARKML